MGCGAAAVITAGAGHAAVTALALAPYIVTAVACTFADVTAPGTTHTAITRTSVTATVTARPCALHVWPLGLACCRTQPQAQPSTQPLTQLLTQPKTATSQSDDTLAGLGTVPLSSHGGPPARRARRAAVLAVPTGARILLRQCPKILFFIGNQTGRVDNDGKGVICTPAVNPCCRVGVTLIVQVGRINTVAAVTPTRTPEDNEDGKDNQRKHRSKSRNGQRNRTIGGYDFAGIVVHRVLRPPVAARLHANFVTVGPGLTTTPPQATLNTTLRCRSLTCEHRWFAQQIYAALQVCTLALTPTGFRQTLGRLGYEKMPLPE
eukprot:m.193095 g.193095  ORF g.193095 m.193095 type:complete len:320 (+) comp18283_c0_seq1:2265-3224(+)